MDSIHSQTPESRDTVLNTTPPQHSKKKWVIAGVLLLIVIGGLVFFFIYKNNTVTPLSMERTSSAPSKSIFQFNGHTYHNAFTIPSAQKDPNITSESFEWVTEGETVDTWTTLVTTHKIHSLSPDAPLSAETYAQNVAGMQEQGGALVFETSLINQDTQALGIDPANPPYLFVYMYDDGTTTEFNMQKIQMTPEGDVVALIYAERFPTKSEPAMKAYYQSPEREAKRVELIKTQFPY